LAERADFSTAADPIERSFDQRSHTYLGYALTVRGSIGAQAREFRLGVGQGAHAKHHFRVGDSVSGDALPVADPRLETLEFYKIGNLKVELRAAEQELSRPRPRGRIRHQRLQSTANAAIGDLADGRTRISARAACGDAGWRSR
jgi:hypothetical protein